MKIDKTQQNPKCRLSGDKYETVNHIISEVAQKDYKTRYDWVWKVIPWELSKRLRFDLISNCKHNPESVLENKTHKII